MTAVAAVVQNRIDLSAKLGGRHWWGHGLDQRLPARGQFAAGTPATPTG